MTCISDVFAFARSQNLAQTEISTGEKPLDPLTLKIAKDAYDKSENVTETLRRESKKNNNDSEIIEIAYDLQAGSYIKYLNENRKSAETYAEEVAFILGDNSNTRGSLLDIGTGELTTISLIKKFSLDFPKDVYAFDISWSRLRKGIDFWNKTQGENLNIKTFVADIKKIPFANKSIDTITSSHALEPNGGSLPTILSELFRVCRDRLVLFEPSYELNTEEGRERMDRLGYIKNIEKEVELLGGTILNVEPVKSTINPLNPTACYVIEPPHNDQPIPIASNNEFSVPGTSFYLKQKEGFLVSPETGLAFPILDGIPVLRNDKSILASSFVESM